MNSYKTANKSQKIFFLLALFWLAMILRSIIATLPPVLPVVQEQLHLSNEMAGATTTIPLICFGVFAFITPTVQKYLGVTFSMTLALTLISIGTLIRIFPYTNILIFSTLCIGIGTALTNVLFPVTLRNHYPNKIAFAMGVFTVLINLGAGLGSVSTPFLMSLGFSWNLALSIWSIPAILTIFFWLLSHSVSIRIPFFNNINKTFKNTGINNQSLQYKNKNKTTKSKPCNSFSAKKEKEDKTKHLSLIKLIHMPLAWSIAGFMGIQGLIYYNFMTWLPTIFESTGFDQRMNGILFGIFNTIAILGSLIGPKITVSKNYKLVAIIFYSIYILTAFSFPIGGYLAIIACVIAGICQGVTYTMGLTLIASQADESTVPSISAFSQGFGYILAAIGPILMGGLYSLSENWWVPTFSIVIAMILNCITFIFSKDKMNKAQIKYNEKIANNV